MLLNKLTAAVKAADVDTLALVLVLAKLAVAADWATVAALLLVLGNRQGRAWLARDQERQAVSDKARLDKLETDIRSLIQTDNLRNLGRNK